MKVSPVQGPGHVQDLSTPEHVRTARATAAFNRGQSSQSTTSNPGTPPVNQNSISAEEMGAVIPTPNIRAQDDNSTGEAEQSPVVTEEAAPKAEETKPSDPLSAQYALLARKEKALRARMQQQEAQLKSKEAELRAQIKAELEQDYNQRYIPKDRFRQDPLDVLAENEMSYEQLTQRLIDQQSLDPAVKTTISRLEAKIAKLEAANESATKNYQDNQQQSYQAALNQITSDVKALVNNDPNFEVVKATNSVKDVVDLIERVYKEEGTLLSVEQAAQQVEDYLLEEATKLNRISKIQKRLSAGAQQRQAPAAAPAAKSSEQPQKMKTLTNAAASSRPLSARERALLAFRGELK